MTGLARALKTNGALDSVPLGRLDGLIEVSSMGEVCVIAQTVE